MRDELARLLAAVGVLLGRRGFSEVEAVTDVWLTLLQLNRPNCAFLGAIAVVQIAKAEGPPSPWLPNVEANTPVVDARPGLVSQPWQGRVPLPGASDA
jgi:hypothetical protein